MQKGLTCCAFRGNDRATVFSKKHKSSRRNKRSTARFSGTHLTVFPTALAGMDIDSFQNTLRWIARCTSGIAAHETFPGLPFAVPLGEDAAAFNCLNVI